MIDLPSRLALKERLPRSWPAFFERHGNFTAAQLAAIPALLDGQNIVVVAPTAGGKTETAMAPLVECHGRPTTPDFSDTTLTIIYVVPTKALVNDLYARLEQPLALLRLTLGVRTRDRSTWRAERPPRVLITTPESLDALLADQPRAFANVRAMVIDELHLLDGTARGDQLRILLNRIRSIRRYAAASGDAPDDAMQYVALSATLPHPVAVASRYFPQAQAIQVAGTRAIQAESIALDENAVALRLYLQRFHERGWHKALVFCNSRAEVEAFATAVRSQPPFGEDVYVHYSNLDAARRMEIEQRFTRAEAALCFATSTLELGIDIGNIDVVILIGPPSTTSSFWQRVGRGNRRRHSLSVACFYRTPLEYLLFAALLSPIAAWQPHAAAGKDNEPTAAPSVVTGRAFRPSVAIQQIFSLLKQSRTGAVRLAELASLCEGMVSRDDLAAILNQLWEWQYVTNGRPGEWRAWTRLNDLVDKQGLPDCPLSLYSNVQNTAGRTVEIRDQHTHQPLAHVDAQWFDRDLLTLEGRPITVEWSDGEALWVTPYHGQDEADSLNYRSERPLLSYELASLLATHLGLEPGAAPLLIAQGADRARDGWWWFHWLGDLYGRTLYDLLRYQYAVEEASQPGLCLFLPIFLHALPQWSEAQVERYVEDNYRRLEPLLALGPYQRLLPLAVRRQAIVAQFDIPLFLESVAALRPVPAPSQLSSTLEDLLR